MISSVERRRTFADFRREGLRVRHGVVRLNHLPPERLGADAPGPQVAFAISRAFGNAVARNRGRRRLRAAFVDAWQRLTPERSGRLAGAFLVGASPVALVAPYRQLVADIESCFDELVDRLDPVDPAGVGR